MAMNFGFDVIDKRAEASAEAVAMRWHYGEGKVFEVSNDDLRHHSDVAAQYLSRFGVGAGSVVALYGLEQGFEFAIVLAALAKLSATAMFEVGTTDPVRRCNEAKAYAVICHCCSEAIELVDRGQSQLQTIEIKISFGYPYPEGWFDLHTGMRLTGPFKRPAATSEDIDSMIIFQDNQKIVHKKNYPMLTTGGELWDRFYRSMREGYVFEF